MAGYQAGPPKNSGSSEFKPKQAPVVYASGRVQALLKLKKLRRTRKGQ